MTNEKKLEIIRSYIEEIKAYEESQDLPFSKKQHLKRAREAYMKLYRDAEKGKLEPDLLHENITSFMYMLQ